MTGLGILVLLLLFTVAVVVVLRLLPRRYYGKIWLVGLLFLTVYALLDLLKKIRMNGPPPFPASAGLFVLVLFGLLTLLLIWGIVRLFRPVGPGARPAPRPRADLLKELRTGGAMSRTSTTILFIFLCLGGLVGFWVILALLNEPGSPLGALFLFSVLIAFALGWGWAVIRVFREMIGDARPAPCPGIDLLKELLTERLPPREQARLAAHLEVCTACQHRVEGLTAGQKSWPGVARKLTQQPPLLEPALKQVMENLKRDKDPEPTRDVPVSAGDLPLGFLSPPDKEGQLGKLERYEVLAEIGRGGMGVVLKAFDPSLHRVVAIKVLAPHLATSGVARKRFLREAKAAAAVTHDHIVTIHAVDQANGLPYLVMQYVVGLSLQERLDKDGPLEPAEVLRIGMQTASGLAAAHNHGIVHRDVKPANILLEEGVQRVKITDFGLARAMDDASLTQSGCVAGSPLYMAPEQARGEALDHRADLFSLGSVLYTMCTGRPPFRAGNALAVLRRVSEDAPRPIRETNPEVPDWLAAVIDKLQAKDPGERFQSAGEVVEVLGQHLARLQHAAWVPPPSPAPAGPNAGAAGLPTSLTLCPSCGAHLHVPERMVGSLVHCAECGQAFQVKEGSEVIQVARAVPSPLGPGFFDPRWHPKWRLIVAGLVALLLALVLLSFWLLVEPSVAPPAMSEAAIIETPQPPPIALPQAPPFWKSTLSWFPPEATLFGAIDLRPFGSFTLDDALTRNVLRLFAPGEASARLTPENLGRIRIDGLGLAYYEDPKTAAARGIVHVEGLALDGRRRIIDFIRQATAGDVQVEQDTFTSTPNKAIRVSSPQLPFVLGLFEDNHAFLARSLKSGKESEHRKVLGQVNGFGFPNGPPVLGNLLSGYNPPWLKAALAEVPPDACGLCLGEIPPEWRKVLTGALGFRACPRPFVFYLRGEGDGVGLYLSLHVDKAGAEQTLQQDLQNWCRRGATDLRARYPVLGREPKDLELLAQTLKRIRWGANPGSGCVQTYVQVSGPTWRALGDLLKRATQPD